MKQITDGAVVKRTFMDIPNAAELAGFSVRHFRRIIEEERIRIVQIGKKFFILGADFERWQLSKAGQRAQRLAFLNKSYTLASAVADKAGIPHVYFLQLVREQRMRVEEFDERYYVHNDDVARWRTEWDKKKASEADVKENYLSFSAAAALAHVSLPNLEKAIAAENMRTAQIGNDSCPHSYVHKEDFGRWLAAKQAISK